jgi:hypothetical protein
MYYIFLIEKLCFEFGQNATFAKFCYYFSFLFSAELFVLSYSVLVIACTLLIFTKDKEIRYNLYSKLFDFFSQLGFIFFTFVIVYLSAKTFFASPRPNNANDLTSFPSAHSGLAFLLFCHFYKQLHRAAVFGMCMLVVINSIVLLSLRCHYVIDIVCGILLAPVTRILGIVIYKLCLKPIQFLKRLIYKIIF